MSNINVVNQYGHVVEGTKFGTYQDLVAWFEKNHTSYLPGEHKPVTFGNTTPAAEDQDRPWIRTESDGSPDRTYVYFNGNWVARHPIAPNSPERRLWTSTLEALRSHDGGDGTTDTPTATTGAMWIEDEAFRDRIPMGVKADDGVVPTPLATAGAVEQELTITTDNLPRHRHEVSIEANGEAEADGDLYDVDSTSRFWVDGAQLKFHGTSSDEVGWTRNYGKLTPDPLELSKIPPVVGVYYIKRSDRAYYVPGE